MNYTVIWEPSIRRELHYLWAFSPDPAAVLVASDTAEERLAADPFEAGVHLSEGLWRLHLPPLVLHYSIDQDRKVVEITDVQSTE